MEMTFNESKNLLRNICEQQGITLHKNIYAFVNNPIKMWRFLVAFSSQNFPLGFDMFDGTCSGDAKLLIKNDFVSLIAADCGTSEFLFVPRSMIIIIPDTNSTPTFVFESDDYSLISERFGDNIRESLDSYDYKYIEAVKLINDPNNSLIINKEEVDEIINDWNSGREEASPYLSSKYYLSRKIFASINIQLKPENLGFVRIPLLLKSSFPMINQNRSIQEIDNELRELFK